MRVGMVTGEYPPMQGGIGAFTRIMAHHIAGAGHEVYIFSRQAAEEPDPALHLTNAITRWSRSTNNRVRRWAQDYRLDLVNLQFETAAFDMSAWVHFLPGFLGDIPLVTTFHDLLVPYLFPKAGPVRRWIVNRLARQSNGVIVTNHEDYYQLQDLGHVTLIPIGSNIPTDLPADYQREDYRRRAGAGPGDFLLGYFGFLNRSKGVEILLEDLAVLRHSGYPVKLVMIGGRTGSSDPDNAAYAEEIEALVGELDLTDHVTWTGYMPDEAVSAMLSSVDAVVLPFRDGASYRRGSLMAAINHGTPIITTQPRTIVPLFRDMENMLMVRGQVLHEDCPPFLHISPAVIKLYRNADLRDKLRQGALALAENFLWETIAADTLSFFTRIVAHHRRQA